MTTDPIAVTGAEKVHGLLQAVYDEALQKEAAATDRNSVGYARRSAYRAMEAFARHRHSTLTARLTALRGNVGAGFGPEALEQHKMDIALVEAMAGGEGVLHDLDREHFARLHRLQHDKATIAKPKLGGAMTGWAADEIEALRARPPEPAAPDKLVERAVMVCPQCEGEGGYPDGVDEDACHTDCTRCGGNGWIVDLAALATLAPGSGEGGAA